MVANVVWGVLLTFITEFLSPFHAITRSYLFGMWGMWALAAAVWVWHAPKHSLSAPQIVANGIVRSPVAWAILIIILVTGILGICSAPSNSDSMIYHLARVMHWFQNKSVAHFPANFHPQLYHGPWAEFAILHLQVLTDGDRFAFAIQWIAMISSVLLASLLAQRMGAGAGGQLFAACFVATLPAGIMQSESTQNSYVVALWILTFVYATFRLRNNDGHRPLLILLAGCAAGLAVLTKGTAYLFLAPFILWLILNELRGGPLRTMKALTVIGACVMILNAGYYCRNIAMFNAPLIPRNEQTFFRVDEMSPALWASNITRHIALQLWLPSKNIAHAVESGIVALHHTGGMDASDPRITVPKHRFQLLNYQTHEDISGNPLHFALIVLALGICVSETGKSVIRKDSTANSATRNAAIFLAIIAASFAVFCLGVKWMEYNGRLELPVFLLAAAPTAVVFSKQFTWKVKELINWAMIFTTAPFLFTNPSHCMLRRNSVIRHSREEQYFANDPASLLPYERAADLIVSRGCIGPVGAALGGRYEYPLWILIKNRSGVWPEIVDVPGTPTPPHMPKLQIDRLSAIISTNRAELKSLSPPVPLSWELHDLDGLIVAVPTDGQVPPSGSCRNLPQIKTQRAVFREQR